MTKPYISRSTLQARRRTFGNTPAATSRARTLHLKQCEKETRLIYCLFASSTQIAKYEYTFGPCGSSNKIWRIAFIYVQTKCYR